MFLLDWVNSVGDFFSGVFANAQEWLFTTVIQPLMFNLGMAGLLEDAYVATAWLLVGILQVIVLVAVIGPLQRWRPVEPVTDRAEIRTDVIYTLIHRLGLFRVALFFTLEPVFDSIFGLLRTDGYGTFHLDQLWPGVTDNAFLSFAIYLVIFDFVGYWVHRGQHQLEWWWRLHSLHHSQQQMTMWSDNRNHLLDDILGDVILVVIAQLIGVGPSQFVAIVALTQLSESFQHANLKIWFGRVGERLWVSPRFHRRHHSIGIGHESPVVVKTTVFTTVPAAGQGVQQTETAVSPPAQAMKLGGNNFGVLLPWWDMMFGTANFEIRYDPTGIRDQVEKQRDYGRGFWRQQWLGLKRLAGRA
ncbi:MAG: fatty acid hydroxylase family protein [Comamonadaceae bacterium]|nr:MAG: fatty acid hydroxylase family protein [Comamonadaceae bacterium]